jgi:penicillin-binding protein 2
VLPSPQWKQQRFRRPEQQKWYPGETISIGIGQGYNAYTPMQLAVAVATLANGGTMMRPHLVSRIDNLRTGGQRVKEPAPLRRVPLRPENLEFVIGAMAGVNREGTGARTFAGAPYTSAGKTGTAQVVGMKQNEKYDERRVAERHRDHSLFIVFAPVEQPKIALAVLVENGGFGARAAAPIARAALDYYLLGKLPENLAPPAAAEEADGDEESD